MQFWSHEGQRGHEEDGLTILFVLFVIFVVENRGAALAEICDGILEDAQPVARRFRFATGPARVLGGIDVTLGMRHEAEDVAGSIADAGDVALGAVGILGIGELVSGEW